jgi:hypothetical protein
MKDIDKNELFKQISNEEEGLNIYNFVNQFMGQQNNLS